MNPWWHNHEFRTTPPLLYAALLAVVVYIAIRLVEELTS